MTSFSEFASGVKRRRRASDVDGDEDDDRWADPYMNEIRQLFPMKHRTDLYEETALDPRFHSNKFDVSEFVAPSTLPALEDLDFTIFSADIVCKFYSQKPSGSNWNFMLPSIGFAVGSLAGLATYYVITGASSVLADYIYSMHIPTEYIGTATAIATNLESRAGALTQFGMSVGAAFLTGSKTGRKVQSYVERNLRKRRRLMEVAQTLQNANTDSNLSNLKNQCLNIYALLCDSRVECQTCEHNDPYNCRKAYLESFGNSINDIQRYLHLPNSILTWTASENFERGIHEDFMFWKDVINKLLPGASGEVGLILTLLYRNLKSIDRREAIASNARGMLTRLFLLNKEQYKAAIRSCLLAMLMSSANDLIEFLQLCIFPKGDDKNKLSKTSIIEEVWQEIENKLNGIEIDIRIRKQHRFNYQGNAMPPEQSVYNNALDPVQENQRTLFEADVIDAQLRPPPDITLSSKMIIRRYCHHLIKRLTEGLDISLDAWIIAVKRKIDSDPKIQRKEISNPLLEFCASYYNKILAGDDFEEENLVRSLQIYRKIKYSLLSGESRWLSAWTKDEDWKTFNTFKRNVTGNLNTAQEQEIQRLNQLVYSML